MFFFEIMWKSPDEAVNTKWFYLLLYSMALTTLMLSTFHVFHLFLLFIAWVSEIMWNPSRTFSLNTSTVGGNTEYRINNATEK